MELFELKKHSGFFLTQGFLQHLILKANKHTKKLKTNTYNMANPHVNIQNYAQLFSFWSLLALVKS